MYQADGIYFLDFCHSLRSFYGKIQKINTTAYTGVSNGVQELNLAIVGVLSSIWLVVGVWIAGKKYPNYSHINQFLSELGALGSPTQKLSPKINNFPLSLLFIVFGYFLMAYENLIATGVLIILHGAGTAVAGIFPMDSDPYTKNPSKSGRVHALAGLVMFLSLSFAQVAGLFHTAHILKYISAASLIITAYSTYKLTLAFKIQLNVGLWQRVSYGSQMFWLSVVSLNYLY